MIDEKRKNEAKANFDRYLEEGLIKKEKSIIAKEMYLKNAELSLQVATELAKSSTKPQINLQTLENLCHFLIKALAMFVKSFHISFHKCFLDL